MSVQIYGDLCVELTCVKCGTVETFLQSVDQNALNGPIDWVVDLSDDPYVGKWKYIDGDWICPDCQRESELFPDEP